MRVDSLATSSSSSNGVWEELKERERREANLIIHNFQESTSADKKECEARDLSGLQKLFNLLGVRLEVAESVKFIRREGEKKSDQPRPLKVVMRRKVDRDIVLSNAHLLKNCSEELWRKVSVVSDLTKMQRQDEADLRKLAASKNLERSQEEVDKGLAWKVVGKRGNKRIQLVELYKDEIVLQTGEVQLAEARGKRNRSPGLTPPRQSSKHWIEPGEFGDRMTLTR